jgi:ureidoacrylate peracid hydrolase
VSWHDKLPQRVTGLAELLRPAHAALVMVDMQNDFVHEDGILVKQWGKTNLRIKPIIPRCVSLLESARRANVTVVHLQVINDLLRNSESWHNHWGPPCCVVADTWGAAIIDELQPRADEVVITKFTYDGFVGTLLDAILRRLCIRTVVWAGVDSDVCVRDTAAHGFALGYSPVFARDAMASESDVAHDGVLQTFAEHYGPVVETAEIEAIWRQVL